MKYLHQPNMKLVIFDFDGTIADTSEGILDSHRFALKAMGREVPCDDELRGFIGGNLLEIYREKFGFSEAEARNAVRIYRERYGEVGIHKSALYPEFSELIKILKSRRHKVGVATLKIENFANMMLNEMKIASYFDVVCGMDEQDHLNKAGLIKKCCLLCEVDESDAILIGDTDNDAKGAEEAGVKFVGVTYGFGFTPNESYKFDTANRVIDILRYI